MNKILGNRISNKAKKTNPQNNKDNRSKHQRTIIKIAFGITLLAILAAFLLTSCAVSYPTHQDSYDQSNNQSSDQSYYENPPGCVFLETSSSPVIRCVDAQFNNICYVYRTYAISCLSLPEDTR